MKLYILEDKIVQLKQLNALQISFETKHFNFSVVKCNNKYLLHTGIDAKASSNELKTNDFTQLKDSKGNICELLLIESNDADETYQKYHLKNIVSIGNTSLNDIQFHMYTKSLLQINLFVKDKSNIIIDKQSKLISKNGKLLENNDQLNFMDELLIGGTRIIFMDEAIMVNCSDNVTVHLPLYQPHYSPTTLNIEPKKTRIYNQIPTLNDTFKYSFQCDKQIDISFEDKPILLMIAPSLLMSLASLLVGILSAYYGYRDGRDIYTLLPMLILPGVMVLSTLLFQPLNKHIEKKLKKKKETQLLQQQQSQIEKIKQDYLQFSNSYEQYCQRYYPNCLELIHKIENENHLYIHNPTKSIYLRFGESKHVLKTINESNKQDQLNLKINKDLPWLVNLNTYTNITIIDPNYDITYLQYLLLQLETQYEIPIVLICKKDFYIHNNYLLKLNNLRYLNNRLLIIDNDDFISMIHHLQKNPLIIKYHSDLEIPIDTTTICFTANNTKQPSLLTINLSNHKAYDHIHEQEFQFHYDIPTQIDMNHLLFLLRRDVYIPQNNDFYSMNQIQHINPYWIEESWKAHDINESIEGILGLSTNQETILLDLNENKDGPHGLIAGTTGSGKTELLLSYVLSLSLRYSYEDLQFAFIDFKGGGGALALEGLPHLISVLTNLDKNKSNRALISFKRECEYRQKCFKQLSSSTHTTIKNIQDYRNNYNHNQNLPRLADLVIIVDEFAELKNEYPEFLKDLISIARIGRSLGVHLILCTQKPTGIVSEEIWSNSNFKICLKVLEKRDSNEIIHNTDAYYLQNPGEFILLSNNKYKKGLAAYANSNESSSIHNVKQIQVDGSLKSLNTTHQKISQINTVLQQMRKIKTHPIRHLWLNELERLFFKDNKQYDCIGIVDDYYECSQLPLKFFTNHKYNNLIVSVNMEEKRNFLQTLFASLISTNHLNQQIFMIDDIFLSFDSLYQSYKEFSELLTSDSEELMRNLFKYLFQKSSINRYLIITDISRFYEANEEYRLLLRKLLERSYELNVYIVIFASSISVFSYRDLTFMHNRYSLMNENTQEIQTLFETNEKHITTNPEWGLLKQKHLLSFRYYLCDMKTLLDLANNHNYNQQRFRIQCIPEFIERRNCDLSVIPIGISYSSIKWVNLRIQESMYVVSLYKDEFMPYLKEMKVYAKCTTRQSMDEDDGQLIFLSIDEYRNNHNDNYPVLYIGTSFHHQFLFHSKHKYLKEGQALLFKNYESELLKVL